MPRTHEALSDVTRNACQCPAHDLLFQKGQGCERDLRIESEAPVSLVPFESGPPAICAFWRDTVMLHAMIASGATCEHRHRAGSGITIVHTYDQDHRFYFDLSTLRLEPRVRFRTLDEGDE